MGVKQHFTISLPLDPESWGEVVLTREQAEELLVDLGSALYPEGRWDMFEKGSWSQFPSHDIPIYPDNPRYDPEDNDHEWAEPELGSPATYGMSVEEAERKLAEQQATANIPPVSRQNSGSQIGVRHIG